MISFQHVSKEYPGKRALDDLTVDIREGEIFGLIGHNGAGKTTTIECLVSVQKPTSGEILVDGQPLAEHRETIKQKIGYVPDTPDMFLRMTAEGYWQFMAQVYEVPPEECAARLDRLCAAFEMEAARGNLIESFSHGMRQKTFVIGALLSNPEIWVLDEPMTGLDPQSAYNLKQMMREHADAGKTVLFSTHVLAVAQEVCDRIAILRHGKLLFCGTMDELRRRHGAEDDSLEAIYLDLVRQAGADEAAAAEEAAVVAAQEEVIYVKAGEANDGHPL